MDWKAIEKMVDLETEKKTRDISFSSQSPYQPTSGLYSQSLYSRPNLTSSPPPPPYDRSDRYVSTTNNSIQDFSFASRYGGTNQPFDRSVSALPNESLVEDRYGSNRTQSPPHPSGGGGGYNRSELRSSTNDLNSNRPNYSSTFNNSAPSLHGQLVIKDDVSEFRQLLYQHSHRLQELEETLSRTVEGQQNLQRQRVELTERCNIYEQEIKTLKSSHYNLHKEKEELIIQNHKLQSTLDHFQSNYSTSTENYATKETLIKFIDSTMEQMKILNQNIHVTSSKNQEMSLTLDNFIISILDMGASATSSSSSSFFSDPNDRNNNSGGGNNASNSPSTSSMIQTYQLLKSNHGFSEQIKSLIQSSLSQNIHLLFQSSIKGFQDNLQSYINLQLKDFKEKQLQSVQTFLDQRVNTFYQNELNIVKADIMQFKHTFDEYQKIHQVLASQLQSSSSLSRPALMTKESKEQEETINQFKEKTAFLEKSITELQNQQKQYHIILTNQNDIITNNTNLQESSRMYYDNYFKTLLKDYNELEKKLDNSLKSYQLLKEELLSENWVNQNKIIKDLSDRHLLVASQMNQMKTELQDTVNYMTSQIITNNNNLREEFALLLKNKDLKVDDILSKLTQFPEITTQLYEIELLNKKNSKEIEEVILMMKSSDHQQKVLHEQHQLKLHQQNETFSNFEKTWNDQFTLHLLKQKEKNTQLDAQFIAIQEQQQTKWNEIIQHQNALLQEMNEKYSILTELNTKTKEQSLQMNEKYVSLLSKVEIFEISSKKELELLKYELLEHVQNEIEQFTSSVSSTEKRLEEVRDELSLVQNKTLLYQENYQEMMKSYHTEFRKYDTEFNKHQLQVTNLQEVLNHRMDKLQYLIDENYKFHSISLSQQEKEFLTKLQSLQQTIETHSQTIAKEIETTNQTIENKSNLVLMKAQSDVTNMKEIILKILQEQITEQFNSITNKIITQENEINQHFNTMASQLLEFSKAFNVLEEEDVKNRETIQRNKELIQSEFYNWKNKSFHEMENLQKMMKENAIEMKYELSQLSNKIQILESHQHPSSNVVVSGGNVAGGVHPSLGDQSLLLSSRVGGPIVGAEEEGGGDHSFSYQHSFLFDPMNPNQQGLGGGGGGSELFTVDQLQKTSSASNANSEQLLKLSSVVELTASRISQLENELFNLQSEVKSYQHLQNQLQLLQDQTSNITKMQQGFMELTKNLALQNSGNTSNSVDNVTIEMLVKVKNELKSDYSEQNRQLTTNILKQEELLQEQVSRLNEITTEIHEKKASSLSEDELKERETIQAKTVQIEQLINDWQNQSQKGYQHLTEQVQRLEEQLQQKATVDDYSHLGGQLQDFTNKLSALESDASQQKQVIASIQENVQQLKQQKQKLSDEVQSVSQMNSTDLDQLKQDIASLFKAQPVQEQSIQRLGNDIEKLSKELEEKIHSAPASTLATVRKEDTGKANEDSQGEAISSREESGISLDDTVQLLQSEIQGFKEFYEKFKDDYQSYKENLQTAQQSFEERLEERIQLLSQQEENNNQHQTILLNELQQELKNTKDLLQSYTSSTASASLKPPPLSPSKTVVPAAISSEAIEESVFQKLNERVSNLIHENNVQTEATITSLLEQKFKPFSSTIIAEGQKRSDIDRETLRQLELQYSQCQDLLTKYFKENQQALHEQKDRFAASEISNTQFIQKTQSAVDSLQNKTISLQEQLQVLQEEVLSLSESKDEIPKLINTVFLQQKDSLLKSFLEEIRKLKAPASSISPKGPVSTDSSMQAPPPTSTGAETKASTNPVNAPPVISAGKDEPDGGVKAEGAATSGIPEFQGPAKTEAPSQVASKTSETAVPFATAEAKKELKVPATETKNVLVNADSITSEGKAAETKLQPYEKKPLTQPTGEATTGVPKVDVKSDIKFVGISESENPILLTPSFSESPEKPKIAEVKGSVIDRTEGEKTEFGNNLNASSNDSVGSDGKPLPKTLKKTTSFINSIGKLNDKLGINSKPTPTSSIQPAPPGSPLQSGKSPSQQKQAVNEEPKTPPKTMTIEAQSGLTPITSNNSKTATVVAPPSSTQSINLKSVIDDTKPAPTPTIARKSSISDRIAAFESKNTSKKPDSKEIEKINKESGIKNKISASPFSSPARLTSLTTTSSDTTEEKPSSAIQPELKLPSSLQSKLDDSFDAEDQEQVLTPPVQKQVARDADPSLLNISPISQGSPEKGTPQQSHSDLKSGLVTSPAVTNDDNDESNEIQLNFDQSSSHYLSDLSHTPPRSQLVPRLPPASLSETVGTVPSSNNISNNNNSNQETHEQRQEHEKRHHLLSTLADDAEFVSSSEESSVMGRDEEHELHGEEDDNENEVDVTALDSPAIRKIRANFPMITTPDRPDLSSSINSASLATPLPANTSSATNSATAAATTTITAPAAPSTPNTGNVILSGSLLSRNKK